LKAQSIYSRSKLLQTNGHHRLLPATK